MALTGNCGGAVRGTVTGTGDITVTQARSDGIRTGHGRTGDPEATGEQDLATRRPHRRDRPLRPEAAAENSRPRLGAMT